MTSRFLVLVAAVLGSPGCSKDSSPADMAMAPLDMAVGPDLAVETMDLASPPADSAVMDLLQPGDMTPVVIARINLNGSAHTGVDYPGSWAADPGTGGACDGNPSTYAVEINGTSDDPLFQGEMWGNPLHCTVGSSLPSGNYKVKLYFGETHWGPGCPGAGVGTGTRVFDIALEGQTVLSSFDIFAEGGCAASSTDTTTKPVVKTFTVAVTDGTLNVTMTASSDDATIAAIEVLSAP